LKLLLSVQAAVLISHSNYPLSDLFLAKGLSREVSSEQGGSGDLAGNCRGSADGARGVPDEGKGMHVQFTVSLVPT